MKTLARIFAGMLLLMPVVAKAQTPPQIVAYNNVLSNNNSGTITTGGTFQTLLAVNSNRKGCLIQNPAAASETLFVFVGSGIASTAKSFALSAGSAFSCFAGNIVISDVIQVEAATTSHTFTETDQ